MSIHIPRHVQAANSFPKADAPELEKAAWFDAHRDLLKDIVATEPGFNVHSRGGKVHFQIGHQTFTLDYSPEDNQDRTWMARMLEIALTRLEGSKILRRYIGEKEHHNGQDHHISQ